MIKKLVNCVGVSGLETEVRQCIQTMLSEMGVKFWTDTMGNLHGEKDGSSKKPVILTTYMDEPGLIVTKITKDGYLKFEIVGRVKPEFLVSKRVRVGNQIGIISLKAIHLSTKKERETPVKADQLFIDIGAKSYEDASALVEVGDYVAFDSNYKEMDGNCIMGSALAGRLGCYIALNLLKNPAVKNLHVIFAVQREIQNRGMIPASYNLSGEYAIALDGIEGRLWNFKAETAELGKGPVLIPRTGAGEMDTCLGKRLKTLAKETDIPLGSLCTKMVGAESVLQKNGTGLRCLCLGIPVRYMASPTQVACLDDCRKLEEILILLLTSKEEER